VLAPESVKQRCVSGAIVGSNILQPSEFRRAGAHPWLGTLNKFLSPLQKRTQGGSWFWSGPVWVHMGRSATYWCPKPRKDTY
jgi:hypothetical protein